MNFSSLAKDPTSDVLLMEETARQVNNMTKLSRPFFSDTFPGRVVEPELYEIQGDHRPVIALAAQICFRFPTGCSILTMERLKIENRGTIFEAYKIMRGVGVPSTCFMFLICCCSLSKLVRIICDWGRKSRPNKFRAL